MLLSFACLSAPVDAGGARRAVGRWIAHRPSAHMAARMDRPVKGVRTVRADGADAFHVVSLEGGGFVVVAADDRIEPVIAFADEGSLAEDPKNPLWVLLNLDLPQRVRAHRGGTALRRDRAKMRGRGKYRRWREPEEDWADLLSGTGVVQTASNPQAGRLTSVSDVRVDVLLKSEWNQSTWDNSAVSSRKCYNTYTPNNYVCGCVATAGAQLMRYHRFPTTAVTAVTKSCWVDNVAKSMTMMGGTYDWDLMPYRPASEHSSAQCEAIGKLCYDAGVSTRMNWTSGESGACDAVLAESLVSVFGYRSARCELQGQMPAEKTEDAIYANLDARCPVLLGIHASNGGHEIVADGYGVSGGTIYTHLNLGWSGSNNAWYALPSVSAGGYDFTAVSSVIYNVFPSDTGELITGRILDESGNPIAGATVTAVSGKLTATAATDAKGIYALHVASKTTWTVTPTAEGYEAKPISAGVGTSKSSSYGNLTYETYGYATDGTVGNSWGNDITMIDAKPTYQVEEPVFVTVTRTRIISGQRFETQYRGFLTKKGLRYAWGKDGKTVTEWRQGDGTPCDLPQPSDDCELMVNSNGN